MSDRKPVNFFTLTLQFTISFFVLLSAHSAQAGPYVDPGWDTDDMIGWATSVEDLFVGPMDIAAPDDGNVSAGLAENALGPATSDTTDIISLGDGGSIVLGFETGIGDGEGADFAVFENGLWTPSGLFAEFAFVEVSTNGDDFARFDSVSLRDTAVFAFGAVDPTNYYNLAGDQPGSSGETSIGTGFDLSELADHASVLSGLINLGNIQYVRVIDVIGNGSTFDSTGAAIFDPYATAFLSGGFDLNAIGTIHFATVPEPSSGLLILFGLMTLSLLSLQHKKSHRIQPNPSWRTPMTLSPRNALFSFILSLLMLSIPSERATALPMVDFEDLGLTAESFYNGSDGAGGFTSENATFVNNYNASWGSWDGFAASTITDNTTPGWGNQYGVIPGSGQGGSATYGTSYTPYESIILFDSPVVVESAYFTNATYSFFSMQSGDAYSKQFGGVTGDDPDFFKLAIEGISEAGTSTGVVDFFLADFRFADNSLDYLIDEWTLQDLSSLGTVTELRFSLTSSDNGEWGMNTPAYFAIDSIITTAIPEPSAALLFSMGFLGLLSVRKRG